MLVSHQDRVATNAEDEKFVKINSVAPKSQISQPKVETTITTQPLMDLDALLGGDTTV